MVRTRLAALLCSLLLPFAILAGPARAETIARGGVTLVAPPTYGSCTAAGDTITVTNEAPYARRVSGQVLVQYVVGDGRAAVPGGVRDVDAVLQPGQALSLAITYPSAAHWPLAQSPVDPQMRELHVSGQLEVWEYQFANPRNWLLADSLGAGWDIFCRDAPPLPADTPPLPAGTPPLPTGTPPLPGMPRSGGGAMATSSSPAPTR